MFYKNQSNIQKEQYIMKKLICSLMVATMLFSTVVQPWRHIRIIWNIKKKTNKTQSQGPPKTNEMRSFCMQAGHWYRFKTHLR